MSVVRAPSATMMILLFITSTFGFDNYYWVNPDVDGYDRCAIDGLTWITSKTACESAAADLGICDTTAKTQNSANNPKGCWFGGGGGCSHNGFSGQLYYNSGTGGSSSRGRTSICQVKRFNPIHFLPNYPSCPSDVKRCDDGTYVSRDPANSCNFKTCPVGGTCTASDYNNNPFGSPGQGCSASTSICAPCPSFAVPEYFEQQYRMYYNQVCCKFGCNYDCVPNIGGPGVGVPPIDDCDTICAADPDCICNGRRRKL